MESSTLHCRAALLCSCCQAQLEASACCSAVHLVSGMAAGISSLLSLINFSTEASGPGEAAG